MKKPKHYLVIKIIFTQLLSVSGALFFLDSNKLWGKCVICTNNFRFDLYMEHSQLVELIWQYFTHDSASVREKSVADRFFQFILFREKSLREKNCHNQLLCLNKRVFHIHDPLKVISCRSQNINFEECN